MKIADDSSVLAILVPEAEDLVGPFRRRYVPSGTAGMPTHITLLYPFKSPREIDDSVLEDLEGLFCSIPSFEFRLNGIGRFPEVLYLTPDPTEPFQQLQSILQAHYPEAPPYGGVFPDLIPHLTIAYADDPSELDEIEGEFRRSAEGQLPISALAESVWLYEMRSQGWRSRAPFNFELR